MGLLTFQLGANKDSQAELTVLKESTRRFELPRQNNGLPRPNMQKSLFQNRDQK